MFITQLLNCASSMMFLSWAVIRKKMGSFRFDDGWILRRFNSNFIHVRMRQICPPSVLPMLQHAKGLTTVVVRTQRLVSYRRRSRPSCKSKAPYYRVRHGEIALDQRPESNPVRMYMGFMVPPSPLIFRSFHLECANYPEATKAS